MELEHSVGRSQGHPHTDTNYCPPPVSSGWQEPSDLKENDDSLITFTSNETTTLILIKVTRIKNATGQLPTETVSYTRHYSHLPLGEC